MLKPVIEELFKAICAVTYRYFAHSNFSTCHSIIHEQWCCGVSKMSSDSAAETQINIFLHITSLKNAALMVWHHPWNCFSSCAYVPNATTQRKLVRRERGQKKLREEIKRTRGRGGTAPRVRGRRGGSRTESFNSFLARSLKRHSQTLSAM